MRKRLVALELRAQSMLSAPLTLSIPNLLSMKRQIGELFADLLDLHRAQIARIEALENNNNNGSDHGDTHREGELPALR